MQAATVMQDISVPFRRVVNLCIICVQVFAKKKKKKRNKKKIKKKNHPFYVYMISASLYPVISEIIFAYSPWG